MVDIQYKKGELLLDENVVVESADGSYRGICKTPMRLNQDVLIIEFNEIEYECKAIVNDFLGYMYGAASPDSSNYPFVLYNVVSGSSPEEAVMTDTISLYTGNPGTYSVKIYAAIEDSDSAPLSPTDFIIAYLMKSPQNSNWNVLSSLLGDGDWSQLKAYVETTPKNMNRQVLKVLLGGESSSSDAVVGTAVVGTAVVG